MSTPQLFRFAGFELDEQTRLLFREGEEVLLQRRVFDLLAYLVRHRDQVLSKDELIDGVWEGAFIADGAVQRAVSLLRSLLRDAGAPNAIRTYPRRGYRFCCPVECGEGAVAAEQTVPEEDEASGRTAFAAGDWAVAIAAFAATDASVGLQAQDLESWADAEQNTGHPRRARLPLERAVAAYAASGNRRGAARAALRLANLHVEGRELSVGQGWHQRASRFLQGGEECHEQGLADWIAARIALFEGDAAGCLQLSERVHELGRRLGDPDLEALGLAYRGVAYLASGEIERGVSLHNEAGAAVLASGVSPWVGSTVYCGIIYGCLSLGDYRRAAEWNEQFDRWCRSLTLEGFSGVCRLHQAEILTQRGELSRAEQEVEQLCERLAESAPWAEGDANRVLGEVRLARGDLDGAEVAFRRAHELGWSPHPGFALLQLARGRQDAAVRGLEQALAGTDWPSRQRRGLLLAHLVSIAAVAGLLEKAREALAELEEHSELACTAAGSAIAAQARGELALAEGRAEEAAGYLGEAIRHWREVPSPCNMAAVRLRLAESLAVQGDEAGAELELSAAEAAFERACLPHLLDRCRELRNRLGAAGPS